MKTRIPLPDFDADDLATVTRLSKARARARQERRRPPRDDDQEALLHVLRGAWTAARSVRDPDQFRRTLTVKAERLRQTA